ncbi:MAG: WXG100 family type VII secretion target [Oscillospiraceae bacterium]|nr:WXG100 family type VII secretion target [Oscillospiraceae bacterium]
MANRIEVDPALLMQQSGQMEKIASSLQSLLDGVLGDLKNVSASWSDKLSNNFAGKIGSAQKSFLGSLNMLKISADSTKRAAAALTEFEQRWAHRMGGKLGADQLKKVPISLLIGKTLIEGVDKLGELRSGTKDYIEKYQQTMPSSFRAWIDKVKGDVLKDTMGDYKALPEAFEKLLDGDYNGAVETIGKTGMESILTGMMEATGLDKTDAGKMAKYYVNVTKDSVSAVTRFAIDPSLKSFMDIGWSSTVQPVVDTAGESIEKVVKLIPGVSEYYNNNGCESIGDMAKQALGDFYGSLTGDEETREYYKHFYDDCDSPFQKIYDTAADAVSFVKESGGIGTAAKRYFETGIGDLKEVAESLSQVGKSINQHGGFFSSALGGVTSVFSEIVK